ncbi:39S ribosomal protein L51, mitochondrial [Blyttiomyces sp. JEL0837]|nr:39S ribosomal protein L51, mitochondrial [Blyttiomyces sp. JEL0837]
MRNLIRKLQDSGLDKRILPTKNLDSVWHNGTGAFVPTIRKVTIHYDHPRMGAGGDSRGMVDFIHDILPGIAKERPYVEFSVQPRPQSPPELIAYYMNGTVQRHVCRHLMPSEIKRHANYLCDTVSHGPKEIPAPQPEANEDQPTRRRRQPRGWAKSVVANLKETGRTDWDRSFWKGVRALDWKTIGRPTDRKFTKPVLPSKGDQDAWDPFHAQETYRP